MVTAMQPPRVAAVAFGAAYVAVGVVGFVAGGFGGTAVVLGFQVTLLHNLVNIAIGATGLGAYGLGGPAAKAWAESAGAVLGLLAIVGIVSSNPFGVIPLGGMDIVLHAASAVILLYVGFAGDPADPQA